MHPSTAQSTSSQPLGFVPRVDNLPSEELNKNEFYQYIRKPENPENNYIIDKYCHTVYARKTVRKIPQIYAFIHSFIHSIQQTRKSKK
jgi:hypothetical protein